MIKSDNMAALAKALVAAQKEMGAAIKDAKNPFFKSNYADLGAVIDAAVPALNKHGIAVLQMPTTVQNNSGAATAVLRTMLLHESGEFVASDTNIVAAKQNDPQAYGSAISYARRYGLQAMGTMKAEDDDGESAMGRDKPKSYAKPDTSKLEQTKAKDDIGHAVVGPEAKAAINEPPAGAKKVSFARKPKVESKPIDNGDDI